MIQKDRILLLSPEVCEVNVREVSRYMGGECPSVLYDCLAEAAGTFDFRAVMMLLDVNVEGERVMPGELSIDSRDLAKALRGCSSAVIFAATVGVGVDRLISRYERVSPSRALCFDAIGSERIEALCDAVCGFIKENIRGDAQPRFSPGYGDLDISVQRDIFRLLDCPKNIGLSLCDSLLMSPSKSVTAIVGVKYEDR